MTQSNQPNPTAQGGKITELPFYIGDTKVQTSVAEYYRKGIKAISNSSRSLEPLINNINCI